MVWGINENQKNGIASCLGLQLENAFGHVIKKLKLTSPQTSICLNLFPAGVYYVNILFGDGPEIGCFTVRHTLFPTKGSFLQAFSTVPVSFAFWHRLAAS